MRIIGWAIDLFLIYWLFTASIAVIPLLVLGDADSLTPSGNALLRLLIVPSLLMMPLLVLSRYRAMAALLLRNPLIPLLLLWVWCSVAWSVAPEISMRRALSLTVYTLLAFYLVLRYDTDRILTILSWMILVLLAVSVVFMLFLPGLSTMPDGRGMRGIFTHKNGMGEFLVLAMIILPPAVKLRLIPKSLGWGGALLALALLPVVNSATALVVGIALVGIYAALGLLAYSFRIAMIALAFALSLGLFAALGLYANLDAVFALTGRDPTFTGRTELWRHVVAVIEQRWLYGYGYEAYWEVDAFQKYVAESIQWDAPNAHNGYLDVMLGLGAIGLTLFFLVIGSAFYRIVMAFKRAEFQPAGVLLGLICAYCLRAVTESNLFGQNSLMWILIAAFTVALTPSLARIRERTAGAQGLPQALPNPA